MKTLIFLIISCFVVCSCSRSLPSKVTSDYEPFPEAFTQDLVALKGAAPYSMEELAFSFPVFETNPEYVRRSIANGDILIEQARDFWKLEGDGAQTTIQFERISKIEEQPVRIRLAFGPVFDGYADSPLPATTYIYEFERGDGGWRKSSSRRVVSGSEIY